MALVLVLGLVAAFAGLLANILPALISGAHTVTSLENTLRFRVAINSTIELVAHHLRDPATIPVPEITIAFGDIEVRAEIMGESDRIDLNAASPEELQEWLATFFEETPELALVYAHRIVDWRDNDDLRQLEGAEADDYRREGLNYAPADMPFRHPGELRDLIGMPPDLVARLIETATVVGNSSQSTVDTGDGTAGEEPSETEAVDEQPEIETPDVENTTDTLSEDDAEASDVSAPGQLYRLLLHAQSTREQSSLSSEALILIETSNTNQPYEILDYQTFRLADGSS